MKQVLCLAMALCVLNAYGQKSVDTLTNKRRLQIGVSVSPDYCFRTTKNDGSSGAILVNEVLIPNEQPKFGYSAGINFNYKLTKRFSLKTGIQYSNKGYQTKFQDLLFENQFSNGSFISSTNGSSKGKIIYNYSYVGVPVMVMFGFGERKISFEIRGGFVTSYLFKVGTTSVVESEGNPTTRSTTSVWGPGQFRAIDVSPTVGLGVNYKVSKRINLIAGPTFCYGILNTGNYSVTDNLWSAGVDISCYFTP